MVAGGPRLAPVLMVEKGTVAAARRLALGLEKCFLDRLGALLVQ